MRGLPAELLDLQYKAFDTNETETSQALRKVFKTIPNLDDSTCIPLLFMNKLSEEEYVSYIKNKLLSTIHQKSMLKAANISPEIIS
jgi:hypothetical protein